MNGANHLAAAARLFAPTPGELRECVQDGLARAVAMAQTLRSDAEAEALGHQLVGLQRTVARLRERMRGASHASP